VDIQPSRHGHVSWVELYFDLVFVFAVGQLAHLIVVHPGWPAVLLALGLFATLWWTWIGFVVLYNRHGEDRATERLFMLAGTVPCAIAAVEARAAAEGDLAGFALALAGTRLVLAVAYPVSARSGLGVGRRAGFGYAVSTVLFLVSVALSTPWIYLLWIVTLAQEASFLLLAARPGRRRRWGQALPGHEFAVNARHLSERFNLFMIIMMGEVVISVSSTAADVSTRNKEYWLGLVAGLVLAGALWWIYFDSAAYINEYMLDASGGNATLAYGIYAGGYLLPTFALLVISAGCGLSLQEQPPPTAVWLVTVGLAAYLVGVRSFVAGRRGRRIHLLRVVVIALTVSIALLDRVLIGPVAVAAAAVWAVIVAATITRRSTVDRSTGPAGVTEPSR